MPYKQSMCFIECVAQDHNVFIVNPHVQVYVAVYRIFHFNF